MASRLTKSYSCGFCPEGWSLSTQTVGDLLDKAAEQAADQIAIVSLAEGIRKTYRELKVDVEKFSSGLLELGLLKGDLVGLWSPNNYECVVVHFAVAKVGMILVPINPAYRVSELKAALPITECKVIVIAEALRSQDFHETLCSALPGLKESTSTTLDLQSYPSLKHVIKLGNSEIPGTLLLSEVSAMATEKSMKLLSQVSSEVQFDDPLYIKFTSGTTGVPKGAVITHYNIVNAANALRPKIVNSTHMYNCNPLPLFHTFGCTVGLLLPVSVQGRVVLPSAIFSTEMVVKAIHAEKCNYLMGAPPMFNDILNFKDLGEYDVSSLETVIVGGSACYGELLNRVNRELKVTVLGGYGLTETASALSLLEKEDIQNYENINASSGRLLAMSEVKIVDRRGLVVDVDTPGEILVRNPSLFQEYWKNDVKTKEAIAIGRWFRTGDLGRLDSKGFLYVDGRLKEMVIRGGENIHPRELEELLLTHPQVLETYVVGVSDKRMIEELCACVRLKEDALLTAEDLRAFMKGKISHFKIPKYFVFRDVFPRTSVGKVLKYLLQEEAEKMFGQIPKEEPNGK